MSDYFTGRPWSQKYAKKALPILVNLAESHNTTTYVELASLLGDKKHSYALPNALVKLGTALCSLSDAEPKRFGKIPPIELLVCTQRTGRPGTLALDFLDIKNSEKNKMSKSLLDRLISIARQDVFDYPRWPQVLKVLGLKPVTLNLPAPESILPKIRELERHSIGEGQGGLTISGSQAHVRTITEGRELVNVEMCGRAKPCTFVIAIR